MKIQKTILLLAAWGCVAAGPSGGKSDEADSLETLKPGTLVAGPDSLGLDEAGMLRDVADSIGISRPPVLLVGERDLNELAPVCLGDALIVDSGVYVTAQGSYGLPQTLSVRGGRPDGVAYLIDGTPISDSQLEALDLNWLPLVGISRVEVMKGGASSVHGSGAVSGVLDVISTETPADIPMSEVGVWWGSFGGQAIDLSLRRSVTDRFGILGAYTNIESAGWVENSSYEAEKIFAKLRGDIGGGRRLDVIGFRYQGDVELPDSCPGSLQARSEKHDHSRKFAKASITGGAQNAFRIDCYWSDASHTSASQGVLSESNSGFSGFDVRLVRGTGGPEITAVGAGFRRRTLESSRFGDRSSHGLHASVLREISWESGKANVKVRLDKDSQFKVQVSPAATVWILVGNARAVFIRLDRSFAFPSFRDLYWQGPDAQRDPDVDVEHSTGLEVGTHIDRRPWKAALELYWRDVDNIAAWRADTSCDRLRSHDGQATVIGMDTSIGLEYPDWLQTSVSYTVGRAVDESRDELEYVPSSSLVWRLRVGKRVSRHTKVGLSLTGRRVADVSAGRRFVPCRGDTECLEEASLPGHTTVTLYGYVRIDRATVFTRARRLLHGDVYPAWGMPGLPSKSYELGISWDLRD